MERPPSRAPRRTASGLPSAADVVAFWREAGAERWWEKDDAFDSEIRSRFLALHEAAARGKLSSFEETPEGALALLILLDQFPRNLYRGSPRAFASDERARAVAEGALARGFDRHYGDELATFFYVPFMHSERLADQERCVELFEALGIRDNIRAAREHRDIIARFGRFPHRNEVLGRATLPEERDFLDQGGFNG